MHRVFRVQEILLDIFGHCDDIDAFEGKRIGVKNLGALARTCKVFKEPALDILWAELDGLAPLVRCLPNASRMNEDGLYSLKRSLGRADWNIILGFTRRVRACHLTGSFELAMESIEELSQPPASNDPVFPNLREMVLLSPNEDIAHLLRPLTGPRLSALALRLADTEDVTEAIETFLECSNITSFYYFTSFGPENKDGMISHLICQWPNLRHVNCTDIVLNVAALLHLSHIPTLRLLSFKLPEIDDIQSTPSANITLPALVRLELRAQHLDDIGRFFDNLRLPAIERVYTALDIHSTGLELRSFLATLPETCNHHSLTGVNVSVSHLWSQFVADPSTDFITFHHLRPLTVFVNIRIIFLDSPAKVDINEKELLLLASSWPNLKQFHVGSAVHKDMGSGAITPGGFVKLLERCRSLSRLCFAFDTRGYTEIPQGHPWNGLSMSKDDPFLDVRMSPIEEESIEALGVFFHVGPFPDFFMQDHWDEHIYADGVDEETKELCRLYRDRWYKVQELAQDLWVERRRLLNLLKIQAEIIAS